MILKNNRVCWTKASQSAHCMPFCGSQSIPQATVRKNLLLGKAKYFLIYFTMDFLFKNYPIKSPRILTAKH
jgi:hypothetical protein